MTIDTDTVYTSQDGVYESKYVFGSLGIWFIRVDYDGDDAYKYSYTKKIVQVYPAEADEPDRYLNTTIFIGDLEDTYRTGENIPITGTIAPTINQASILISVNGTHIDTVETDPNGCFSRYCTRDQAGLYCFKAEFEGDPEYNPSYSEVFVNVTHPREELISYEPSEEAEQDETPATNRPVASFTSDLVKVSLATLAFLTAGYLVIRRTIFLRKLSYSPSGV